MSDGQMPQPPAIPSGTPIIPPGVNIENQAIDRYRSTSQDVQPYFAQIDNKVYVFNKRPNAKMQLEAMRLFAGDENTMMTPENIGVIHGLMEGMLEDPTKINEIFEAVDLGEIADMLGKAMEKVTARPTTESQPSSTPPGLMTSPTGVSVPGSPTQISKPPR
jgi:hypothetical protein